MPNPKYAAYKASRPYFELVRGALGDIVDSEHFFDIVTDDVVYEVLYDFPGWPRVIQGRANLMDKFRGYGNNIELQSADKLITHKADNGRVFSVSEGSYLDHPAGGCRMGSDPSTSVCDSYGRTHDHENLFVVGAPTTPTGGCTNGTLTFVALTLRSADEIARRHAAR